MMTRTSSGTASTSAAMAATGTYVPVGLLGLQTISILVRGVTAAAMAGRSWAKSSSGTVTALA